MLHPAPTTKIDPTIARGVLESMHPVGGGKPAGVVISFPNTNYQIHLVAQGQVGGEVGKKIIGTIRVDARRVDEVDTGGKYIEPVYGRPRRVQGRVIWFNDGTRTLVVDAGVPVHLRMTDERQTPTDFPVWTLVSCDVRDGATFTPQVGTLAYTDPAQP